MLDLTNPAHGFCVCFVVLLLMWLSAEFGQRREPHFLLGCPFVVILLAAVTGTIASLFMMVAERI